MSDQTRKKLVEVENLRKYFTVKGNKLLEKKYIHFSVRFIICGSFSARRCLVYKLGEHRISRGSFRNEEECSSPSCSWL